MVIEAQERRVIDVENLTKKYRTPNGDLTVLKDVTLAVHRGEFITIVGASGCGKTTLLRILDGLVDSTSGSVKVKGQEVRKPGPERGFVFQRDNLLPWRTISRNVSLGLELQGKKRTAAKQQAQKYLELVGLKGFEGHYPHQLSGGMRQRANIARGFAIHPEILLMDEPFAALDAQTREIMQAELLRIWSEADDSTVLFITHQIDEAVYLADRVVVLTSRPGRIKEIIDVTFPRPRLLAMKRSAEFGAIVEHIWSLIEDEVRQAMQR